MKLLLEQMPWLEDGSKPHRRIRVSAMSSMLWQSCISRNWTLRHRWSAAAGTCAVTSAPVMARGSSSRRSSRSAPMRAPCMIQMELVGISTVAVPGC